MPLKTVKIQIMIFSVPVFATCEVYTHRSGYKELSVHFGFLHRLVCDRAGLFPLFQAEAYLSNSSSCSKAQMLMHGFKGTLFMNMFLNF